MMAPSCSRERNYIVRVCQCWREDSKIRRCEKIGRDRSNTAWSMITHSCFLLSSPHYLAKIFINQVKYKIPTNEDREKSIMTSLGKLVFGDIHERYMKDFSKKSLTQDDSSVEHADSLSLAYENLLYMPLDIIERHGITVNTLDVSYNKFSRNLQFLLEFDHLTSLNLDHNIIDEHTVFPYMPQLELLWLNHNDIDNLYPFIKNLHKSLPNLKYLCLMGNNAAPSYLNDGTCYDHLQYRLFVISWFPKLIHLDDSKVTADQRIEARRLFKRPLFEDILQHGTVPECMKHLHNKITNTFWSFDKSRKNFIV